MLNERSVYSSEHVVDNIKTYVEQNPDKVLTLEKISSLFFLNPSYCIIFLNEINPLQRCLDFFLPLGPYRYAVHSLIITLPRVH